jgi:hypothetical protein
VSQIRPGHILGNMRLGIKTSFHSHGVYAYRARGLPVSGRKAELVERIVANEGGHVFGITFYTCIWAKPMACDFFVILSYYVLPFYDK